MTKTYPLPLIPGASLHLQWWLWGQMGMMLKAQNNKKVCWKEFSVSSADFSWYAYFPVLSHWACWEICYCSILNSKIFDFWMLGNSRKDAFSDLMVSVENFRICCLSKDGDLFFLCFQFNCIFCLSLNVRCNTFFFFRKYPFL